MGKRAVPSAVATQLWAVAMLCLFAPTSLDAQQRPSWAGPQTGGASSPRWNRPSPSPTTPTPQPPSSGGHSGHHGHHGHHHHHHGIGYLYPYPYLGYPYYPQPYASYYDDTLYFVLPPRVTNVTPWGNYTYGGYGGYGAVPQPRVWTPPLNFGGAAAAGGPLAGAGDALVDQRAGVADGHPQRAEILRRVMALRPSTAQGRQRADRLIAEGDRFFADQNYRRAASKYRDAITKAADYPEAHLRAGHAYVATGDFELALTYFLVGLQLAGSVERPGFALADLYRGDRIAKEQHLAALHDAMLRQPEDGGLPFLAGVTLHYDGQPLPAREYFQRAAELPGAQQHYAAMFLPVVPVAEPEP